jgi:nucleoside 2-deoxyribosyltransferase
MKPRSQPTQIYLAGPLFTQGEQDFNVSLAERLSASDYQVFLPQQECTGCEGEDIYKTCLTGLRAAAIVVAILDGADADSGTCWECGYAASRDIPIVAVRTDFRISGDTGGFNAMLYYSAAKIVSGTDRLFDRVIQAIQELETVINK